MSQSLVFYSNVLEIVGDIIKVSVQESSAGKGPVARLGDLAMVESESGHQSLSQVIQVDRNQVSLQVFSGTKGLSTRAVTRFLGHPMQVIYSENILGRVFRGTGEPIDGGPDLSLDTRVEIDGPTVNPMRRVLASKMVRTDVPDRKSVV